MLTHRLRDGRFSLGVLTPKKIDRDLAAEVRCEVRPGVSECGLEYWSIWDPGVPFPPSVSSILKRRVEKRKPSCIDELDEFLHEEWNKFEKKDYN